MRRKIAFLLVAFSISIFSLTALGCADETGAELAPNNIEISSTYNTLKVMRDGDYEQLGANIDVFMAKGETEGAQLIVTPEREIKDIRVNLSDLVLKTDKSVTFSKDNVTVYFQKYHNVINKTVNNENEKYPTGYTPDMMLEQSLAIKAEENSVEATHNQGITIEFETTAETVAGEYEGSFTVVADGVDYAIPVTLKVYDVTLSTVNGKSCFCDYTLGMAGEYDTTSETYKRYYETAMRDYKIMLQDIPGHLDPIEYAKSVDYYYDDPYFTSFDIPNSVFSLLTGYDDSGAKQYETKIKIGKMYSYYWELAMLSEPGRILFDKAYMYLIHFDEARSDKFNVVRTATKDILDLEKQVYDDLVETGYFDKYSEEYKSEFYKSITGVPLVLTGGAIQVGALGADVNTYCVRIDGVASEAERELYEIIEEQNAELGGETWFYTCNEPSYPFPTHHIDDTLLSSRVMRWMQKDYDWEGYLYWSVFKYYDSSVMVDPYEDANRALKPYNGDGWLVYPGNKYGVDTFLPSLRLTTIRDGQEDYDLLCLFDNILAEKAAFYDIEAVDSHLYLQEYYDLLYTDVYAVDDHQNFYNVRKQLFELIKSHQSETKFFIDNKIDGMTATSNIYLENGYSLTVNGEEQTGVVSGQGVKYSVTQELTQKAVLDIEISKDGNVVERHSVFVSEKKGMVTLDEISAPLYCSTDSSITYADGAATVILHSFGETFSEIAKNKPSVGILPAGINNAKLGELDYLEFDITNNDSKDLTIKVRFKTEYTEYNLRSYTIKAGETMHIKIEAIASYLNHWSKLNDATIDIYVDNAFVTSEGAYEKYPDRNITLSNIYYQYKGERE